MFPVTMNSHLSRLLLTATRTRSSLGASNYTNILRLLSTEQSKINFDEMVKGKKIVVFMKGTPDAPRCGFSNAVCQILRFHGVNEFDSYNVLEDEDVRQGIKAFTNWPTIPQVFLDGEFLGGCDIMVDMHKNGDLIEELKKVGIRSALLDAEEDKKS